jgi:hypothetical protein
MVTPGMEWGRTVQPNGHPGYGWGQDCAAEWSPRVWIGAGLCNPWGHPGLGLGRDFALQSRPRTDWREFGPHKGTWGAHVTVSYDWESGAPAHEFPTTNLENCNHHPTSRV